MGNTDDRYENWNKNNNNKIVEFVNSIDLNSDCYLLRQNSLFGSSG